MHPLFRRVGKTTFTIGAGRAAHRDSARRRRLWMEALERRLVLSTMPVTLNITDLLPSFNPDADNPIGGDGDYYAEVQIGNKPEQTTENRWDNPVSGEHLVNPPFWSFTEFVDPADFQFGLIPVQIQIFDSDDNADDVIDINPTSGATLSFLFDPAGGVLEGQTLGNGDGDVDARLTFEMFVSTPVTVDITEFQQIDSPELGGGDGSYKYFVKIGDNTESSTGSFSFPPGTYGTPGITFTEFVKPADTTIKIRIRVADVDLVSGDDFMDINPRSGVSGLTLDYNISTATWVEEGGAFAYPQNFSQGNGDDDRGKIFFNIGSGPDTDGDGLFDFWETHGIDTNGDGRFDLVLNTDPDHKDLFVEVDAMQGLAPRAEALGDVVAAFAAAPQALVQNPDGQDGITLHIQLDEVNIPNAIWTVGFPEFDLIKRNTAPGVAGGFGTVAERGDANAANILAAKRLVYRYSIFANQYGTLGSSGRGEIENTGQDGVYGGNDFFVTLGLWGGGNRQEQAGTFMHELGHTLGLFHGSHQVDETDDTKFNQKPNYHSVMNYIWQMPYVPGAAPTPAESAFINSWILDYSREPFNDLDEDHLDETAGIGGHAGHVLKLADGRFVAESGPVDWDGDGATSGDTDVAVEINGSTSRNVLEGGEDWSRLLYSFRTTRNFSDGEHGPEHPADFTFDDFQDFNEALIYSPGIGDGADELTLRRNGDVLEVFDNLAQAVVASRALEQTRTVRIIGIEGEDDLLTIDFSAGGFFAPSGGIEFLGGAGGNDRLKLIGVDGATGVYTPSATTPGDGTTTVQSGAESTVIAFTALEPLEVSGMASYAFVSPNSADVLSLNAGTATGGEMAYVLSGTSGGVAFESLTVFDIAAFHLDAAANDGLSPDDSITVAAGGSAGVDAIHVTTGAGDDTVTVTASSGAAIDVSGGSEADRLNVMGESLTFALTATGLTTATRQPVTYAGIETLGLSSGVFQVPAASTVTADVDVGGDGVLAGVGAVSGAVSVNSGGTVAPGEDGPGTLHVGDTVFAAGSTLHVDLNGLGSGLASDELRVSGTVDLGNATLTGSLGPSLIVPGDEFVIIRKDGAPVVGEFGNQAAGDIVTIGGKKFAVDYAFDGDNDGQLNDVALIAFGAALAPDPCDVRKMALFVSATTGDDTIRFVPVTGNSRVRVLINGEDQGIFRPMGLLVGFGQAGNDLVSVELPSRDAWLYGQNGDDTLSNRNGNSILLGGSGDDTLTSGSKKDILVGGAGADVLRAGNGDDLLIAGWTAFDSNNAANRTTLCRIRSEWLNGSGGYAGRINHLRFGGGRNGTTLLDSTTVLNDAAVDQLFGGNGFDWFLLNSENGGLFDTSDRRPNETATDI